MFEPLPLSAHDEVRRARYAEVKAAVLSLIDGEDDWTAAMATVACELHHAFAYYHWTGFYRAVSQTMLVVGPYQGGHGCLRIPFSKGVCGAAARTRKTQRVDDVNAFAGHIACSTTTQSEIVVPILGGEGVLAVLDVDSNDPAAFRAVDQEGLEAICEALGAQFG